MKKILSLVFTMICMISMAFAQSNTVSQFSENTQGYTAFLYQSVIRVMNKDQNPDFNMLIRDIDHVKIALTEYKGGDARETFKEIDAGVQGEGYEMIMSYNNKDYKCNVYELESHNGKSTWVTTFMTDGYAGAMEMKGTLDLKYIESLSSLDYKQLESMIPNQYKNGENNEDKDVKEEVKEVKQ